jgi:hypothetical protein
VVPRSERTDHFGRDDEAVERVCRTCGAVGIRLDMPSLALRAGLTSAAPPALVATRCQINLLVGRDFFLVVGLGSGIAGDVWVCV